MKNLNHQSLSISKFGLTLGLSAALTIIAGGQAVFAQNNVDAAENSQSNEVNPMDGNNGLDPMQLIHNMNLANDRSMDEFSQDSNNVINGAANDFKQQQQLLWQQRQQSTTVNNNSSQNTPQN